MADITDINDLLEDSKCFTCLEPGQREVVNTYLLAVSAGGSLDSQTLLTEAQANGFDKLSSGELELVSTSLRWLIAGSP